MSREDVQTIAEHSNWSIEGIDTSLKRHIYHDKQAWQFFLRILAISLGLSFMTVGILFFFAYNWSDLHKFTQFGLIELLIVGLVFMVVWTALKTDLKNILLTTASVLVGVLYAVFGQVYQTGANAYDFFLGWTIAVVLWVLIANFAPLWLIFLTLVNTTVILYAEQVAQNWSVIFICTLLFVVNTVFLLGFIVAKQKEIGRAAPIWLTHVLAMASVCCSTLGIVYGIMEEVSSGVFILLIALAIGLYTMAVGYGLRQKSSFYPAIIALSTITIVATLLLQLSDGEVMFFTVGIFIVSSVTMVIKFLLNLQRRWKN